MQQGIGVTIMQQLVDNIKKEKNVIKDWVASLKEKSQAFLKETTKKTRQIYEGNATRVFLEEMRQYPKSRGYNERHFWIRKRFLGDLRVKLYGYRKEITTQFFSTNTQTIKSNKILYRKLKIMTVS